MAQEIGKHNCFCFKTFLVSSALEKKKYSAIHTINSPDDICNLPVTGRFNMIQPIHAIMSMTWGTMKKL